MNWRYSIEFRKIAAPPKCKNETVWRQISEDKIIRYCQYPSFQYIWRLSVVVLHECDDTPCEKAVCDRCQRNHDDVYYGPLALFVDDLRNDGGRDAAESQDAADDQHEGRVRDFT